MSGPEPIFVLLHESGVDEDGKEWTAHYDSDGTRHYVVLYDPNWPLRRRLSEWAIRLARAVAWRFGSS